MKNFTVSIVLAALAVTCVTAAPVAEVAGIDVAKRQVDVPAGATNITLSDGTVVNLNDLNITSDGTIGDWAKSGAKSGAKSLLFGFLKKALTAA